MAHCSAQAAEGPADHTSVEVDRTGGGRRMGRGAQASADTASGEGGVNDGHLAVADEGRGKHTTKSQQKSRECRWQTTEKEEVAVAASLRAYSLSVHYYLDSRAILRGELQQQ